MSSKTVKTISGLSPGLRRYLFFTATVTGAAIMIIEILGAKMLAPYVGTSHFVWTAQIAVTLVALSVGYYVGGQMADRSAKLSRLYACILIAAIYVALSIVVIEPISYWCLQFRLELGSLLASSFLFFVPLALLAMTGPFLVRVLTSSVQTVGGNAGRLIAVSTVGSFVGTVLIGYVLLPFLRNSVTMFITSALLMAIVAGYFLCWGRADRNSVALAAGVAIGLFGGFGGVRRDGLVSYQNWNELFRGNSNFGLLQVVEQGTQRRYLNDFLLQNTYDTETKQSTSLFTYMLHDLARAYTPNVERVLCIGLGVGIVPMQFAREGLEVDVMEINPAVVPVAEKYFDFDPSRVRLRVGDGRSLLHQTDAARYDAVVLDAFLGDSSPSHLMTREAFTSILRVLKPEGALVINSFGEFQSGKDFFTASLDKTLKAVFASVRIHSNGGGNVFFVASPRAPLDVMHPPDFSKVHSSVRWRAERAFGSISAANPDHGIVLTDDYNPVEFYDAANREAWRRQLAMSAKQM